MAINGNFLIIWPILDFFEKTKEGRTLKSVKKKIAHRDNFAIAATDDASLKNADYFLLVSTSNSSFPLSHWGHSQSSGRLCQRSPAGILVSGHPFCSE